MALPFSCTFLTENDTPPDSSKGEHEVGPIPEPFLTSSFLKHSLPKSQKKVYITIRSMTRQPSRNAPIVKGFHRHSLNMIQGEKGHRIATEAYL